MARIVIREQDLTGNRIDQDFTDIAFIPGFVKYPNKDYQDPQMCWSEAEFIDKFGNEPAIANSKFIYNVSYNGTPFSNPKNGQANFILDTNEVEAVSDSGYHYARELLYRGLPVYYCPMNKKYSGGDLDGQMIPYNGVANAEEPKQATYNPPELTTSKNLSDSGKTSKAQAESQEPIILYRNGGNGIQLAYTKYSASAEGVTYQWYKKDPSASSFHTVSDGSGGKDRSAELGKDKYSFESGSQYYCKAVKAGNAENNVPDETSYSELVEFVTISDYAPLTILEKNDSTTAYVISTQAASEKVEIAVESTMVDGEIENTPADPTYTITAGPQKQVVPYNYNVVYTAQVEGVNVESFSYKWLITEAEENDSGNFTPKANAIEQIISTQQLCKFSTLDFGPGKYIIRLALSAVPSNANILGTININSPSGKEMKASQILAAAKAEAITLAARKSSEQFTGELLDWFTTNDNIELLKDRGMYNFKYLTSGGYPVFQAATINSDGTSEEFPKWELCLQNMLSICGQKTVDDAKDYITEDGSTQRQGRGDCIFLIDHQLDRAQDTMELYDQVRMWFEDPANVNAETLEFAAMYTPWCKYNMTYTSHNVSVNMPASYAYLTCLADSIQAYDNWHAISGVTRGTVKNIQEILLDKPLTNTKANKCQSDPEEAEPGRVSINCITEIKPYGNVIWGNRTLQKADPYKHVTAMGFVNLRNEVSDIKKLVYRAARRWMFEQNTSVLWINFKSTITPLLERMVNGYGLSRYEIRRGEKTKKHKLYAEIRIWPIYAVEYIDVTIQILDEETIVTEE